MWANGLILALCAVWTVAMLCVATGAQPSAMAFMNGEHTADWFAAIGSLAAVAAAIEIARRASLQATMMAKAETVRTIELVCSIGFQICDLVEHSWAELKKLDPNDDANFAQILTLFEDFPIDRYPSGRMALELANIHRLAGKFRSEHADAVSEIPTSATELLYRRSEIVALLPDLAPVVEAVSAEYDALLSSGQAILDTLPGRRVVLSGGP